MGRSLQCILDVRVCMHEEKRLHQQQLRQTLCSYLKLEVLSFSPSVAKNQLLLSLLFPSILMLMMI